MPPFKKIAVTSLLFIFCNISVFTQTPQESIREYYRRGQIYYEHGLYPEAETMFKKALAIAEESGLDLKTTLKPAAPAAGATPRQIRPKTNTAPAKTPETNAAASGSYVINSDDTLLITVWENPDLTREVIVRPDGQISFPLIDELRAKGLTLAQLDHIITEKLKEYIREPDVSVSLESRGGSKIIILGEVERPGVYSLTGERTLAEAIALAGGFTEDAVASSIVIVRGTAQERHAERVSMNKAIHHPDLNQNIILEEENIVFVPKKFIADMNYFLDKILNPALKAADTGITMQKY